MASKSRMGGRLKRSSRNGAGHGSEAGTEQRKSEEIGHDGRVGQCREEMGETMRQARRWQGQGAEETSKQDRASKASRSESTERNERERKKEP